MRALVGVSLVFFSMVGTASAGTITAVGAVKALTAKSQLVGVIGNAGFDEGPTSGAIPLGLYTPLGLTWRVGLLSQILPGVTSSGTAGQPLYDTSPDYPAPIAGGGVHSGAGCYECGVATFTTGLIVTQVGLVGSTNGTQYLTAFGKNGGMLGQVTWAPAGDAAFVGIDTQGVAIGMIAYGNHDLWSGQPYGTAGVSTLDDAWVWAAGNCQNSAQCDDGNPCTNDTCGAGSICVHTNNTASCNDGNPCTLNDVCSGGKCGGAPVVCSALDQCHAPGVCNPATGICSSPLKPNGTACNDSNLCTQTDTCQNGACSGASPVTCAAPGQCQTAGTCDTTTGMCKYGSVPDGLACDDNNLCTQTDTCQNGTCSGASPVTCAALDQCHDVGVCDTTTGQCTNPTRPEGATCDDGDGCTTGDRCLNGVCAGWTQVSCAPADECHTAGTCSSPSGTCSTPSAPDGTPCPDGTCSGGTCVSHGTGGSTTSGNGGSSGAGGPTGTVAATPGLSSGCACDVAGSATRGTPAAALLMLLALRRRLARSTRTA